MRALCFCLALFVGTSACTQTLEGLPPGEQAGPSAGQSGSGTTSTGGASSGAGGGSGVTGSGGTQAGSAGVGGVPTKPGDVFVATPRAARLSRVQWSNTVRDLLKLSDISDIERDITGDAVVGFDNDVESLFVSDTLRADLYAASEKLAARVIGDAAALGAPRSRRCAGRRSRKGARVRYELRRACVPSPHQRRPRSSAYLTLFDQGSALYPGIDPFLVGSESRDSGVSAVAALPLSHRARHGRWSAERSRSTTTRLRRSSRTHSRIRCPTTSSSPPRRGTSSATDANVAAQAARLLAEPTGRRSARSLPLSDFPIGGLRRHLPRSALCSPTSRPATPAAMRAEVLAFLRLDLRRRAGRHGNVHGAGRLRECNARSALRRCAALLQRISCGWTSIRTCAPGCSLSRASSRRTPSSTTRTPFTEACS